MNVTLIMNLGDGEKEAGRHRVESEDMKLGDMTSEGFTEHTCTCLTTCIYVGVVTKD